ncbi:MAG: tRNA (guanosine(37)-N1)-methyltransferase TrmD [Eubacteriaceae bacterium]|nr:tRNA (guanosine(37)-N1)-methyltransferase TrmD [Eubacteriaceae bacterium]
MIFNVATLYPEIIISYRKTGIIARGVRDKAIEINAFDIRDFSADKHNRTDDYPYGGGNGMVMTPQPVCDCIEAIKCGRDVPVIFFSPRGKRLTTQLAKDYAKKEEMILLCGHYEGIDKRALDLTVTEEISIGDYIVTGGHIAAMCFIDAVSRYVPGVLGKTAGAYSESFENGLLEYDQYTRPPEFRGMKVPEVLLSGHAANIAKYQKQQSISITERLRGDLIEEYLKEKQNKG